MRGRLIQWGMFRKPSPQQTELEMVRLEQLVPSDHLLRKVEAAIEFAFIRKMTKDLYCRILADH